MKKMIIMILVLAATLAFNFETKVYGDNESKTQRVIAAFKDTDNKSEIVIELTCATIRKAVTGKDNTAISDQALVEMTNGSCKAAKEMVASVSQNPCAGLIIDWERHQIILDPLACVPPRVYKAVWYNRQNITVQIRFYKIESGNEVNLYEIIVGPNQISKILTFNEGNVYFVCRKKGEAYNKPKIYSFGPYLETRKVNLKGQEMELDFIFWNQAI